MNANPILWFIVVFSLMCTCLTRPVYRDNEPDHRQNTVLNSWLNRQKRDVRMTSKPASFKPTNSRNTYRRWSTRPAGQTWTPFTGTPYTNLTEKEISNRENNTRWNFSRYLRYPTPNRFYSSVPYKPLTKNPSIRFNETEILVSYHHQQNASTEILLSSTVRYPTRGIPKSNDPQSNRESLGDRYAIAIAILSAILCFILLGFIAHCNRVRKQRKVLNITLA